MRGAGAPQRKMRRRRAAAIRVPALLAAFSLSVLVGWRARAEETLPLDCGPRSFTIVGVPDTDPPIAYHVGTGNHDSYMPVGSNDFRTTARACPGPAASFIEHFPPNASRPFR